MRFVYHSGCFLPPHIRLTSLNFCTFHREDPYLSNSQAYQASQPSKLLCLSLSKVLSFIKITEQSFATTINRKNHHFHTTVITKKAIATYWFFWIIFIPTSDYPFITHKIFFNNIIWIKKSDRWLCHFLQHKTTSLQKSKQNPYDKGKGILFRDLGVQIMEFS